MMRRTAAANSGPMLQLQRFLAFGVSENFLKFFAMKPGDLKQARSH
jgi:hypothetical protein